MLLKYVIVGIALAVALVLIWGPRFITPEDLPAGMDPQAPQRCFAVFVLCMALWFTNFIPLAATGVLAIALLPLLGILSKEESFSLFGNSAVFFMLGVFLLAAATITTGLSKRVTLLALQRFDKSPALLSSGVPISAAFLALWMPEHAVAAMIYPILVETVDSLGLSRGHNYAKKLFLGLAWGSIIGGVGTFLGGARAPLALSLLRESHPDLTISFGFWMAAAIPVVLIVTAIAVLMLRWRIPDDLTDIRSATRMLDERVRQLGPLTGKERRLAGLGLLTILAWITVGHAVGLAVIAMLSAVALFVLRIVDWKDVQQYINWGVLLMYGGAVALGSALTETQAMAWLAEQVLGPNVPGVAILILMALAAIILTEGISNAATVAVLLPIGYSLAGMVGLDPIVMTLAVTIPAGLAFMLPISSPPNAISFSAGHYGVRRVIQFGWPMNIFAFAVVVLVMLVWWPILGLSVW
jgi:sodium-dependent dicarboxylate transporter 2/3/5